ncbi:MAG: copper chaperone PCu(A)C [Brevundimonas sp.]
MRIRNGSPVADELVSVSCDNAGRVGFHRIRRGPDGVSMDADPVWAVPGRGSLEVRRGGELNFMPIGFDPAKSTAGQVTVILNFREAVTVRADFALAEDSRAAWAAFD